MNEKKSQVWTQKWTLQKDCLLALFQFALFQFTLIEYSPFLRVIHPQGWLIHASKRAKFGRKLASIQIVQANYEPLTALNNWLRSIMLFYFLTRMQNRNKNNIYVGLNMEKYSIFFLFLFILGQINELLQKIKRVKGKKYIFVSYKNKKRSKWGKKKN